MSEEELISEFIITNKNSYNIEILIKEIFWESPHSPNTRLTVAKTLDIDVTKAELESEIKKVVRNKKYFQECKMCKELNPLGWMHDIEICQSCAENYLGVIY